MTEAAAKALISQEKSILYELMTSGKILTATGAEALSTLEMALGGGGTGEIGGAIDIVNGSITEDIRVISTPDSYYFNNYFYLYIKVLNAGENNNLITLNNAPLVTNEYINLEPIPGRKHGNITLAIASGGSVRIIGGY